MCCLFWLRARLPSYFSIYLATVVGRPIGTSSLKWPAIGQKVPSLLDFIKAWIQLRGGAEFETFLGRLKYNFLKYAKNKLVTVEIIAICHIALKQAGRELHLFQFKPTTWAVLTRVLVDHCEMKLKSNYYNSLGLLALMALGNLKIQFSDIFIHLQYENIHN